MNQRLLKQIGFIREIDRLKTILRRSYLLDKSRRENDAEHSWHISVAALLLSEYADEKVNILKVIKMLLIHDIVEIDAGDTFIYDDQGHEGKFEKEQEAARRLFGLLPDDQQKEFSELWMEFEEKLTPEAKYAAAIDRMAPLLHNYYTGGKAWQEHGITSDKVFAKNSMIQDGSDELWQFARFLIEDAVEKGFLKK